MLPRGLVESEQAQGARVGPVTKTEICWLWLELRYPLVQPSTP